MQKILVAEDEKALNKAYEMILKRAGYRVKCAYDGEEALKLSTTFKPDLILLDLRMPKMTGIEFLKEYRQLKGHKGVKIIVFSNLDMQKEIDLAFELGATKYMLKAWASPDELQKMVARELET
jgi:CheY-like chemotaxis protein